MFGPPLEMFHCGGTSIVYDVTGHDEYIVHDKNGLVVKTDEDEKVVEYINKLKDDKKYLNKLKKEAIKTAKAWVSWEESSMNFYETVKKVNKLDSINQVGLENRTKFFFDVYEKYENKDLSMKKFIGRRLRIKHPKMYRIYRNVIGK